MSYAIYQDMQEIYKNPDKWINHGRNILEENCNHHDDKTGEEETKIGYYNYCEECDISEISAIPIINYLYPLELSNFDDDKILKVVKGTNCTILENTETGEWFLALCGGGMDLSQDIALSYVILERWIPKDLICEVISQKNFSISDDNFKILQKEIIEQSRNYFEKYFELNKMWSDIK